MAAGEVKKSAKSKASFNAAGVSENEVPASEKAVPSVQASSAVSEKAVPDAPVPESASPQAQAAPPVQAAPPAQAESALPAPPPATRRTRKSGASSASAEDTTKKVKKPEGGRRIEQIKRTLKLTGDFSINTIIGPNTNVWGNIEAGGFTRVDGNVHGDMDAKGRVVVGERARLKSNISGTQVTIGGVVRGNVIASDRLLVLSTGLIIGDVITRRIQIDEGSVIHGQIIVCESEDKWIEAVAAYKDALGVQVALGNADK